MKQTIEVKNAAGKWVKKVIEVASGASPKKAGQTMAKNKKTDDGKKKKPLKLQLKPALMTGLKFAAPIGAGALASVVGGGLVRAFSPTADAFSDTPTKTAAIDAAAGAVLAGAGLFAYGKLTTPKKAVDAAPLVMAGAIGIPVFRALAPMVMGYVEQGISMLMGDAAPAALPAGAYADIGSGLQGRLPAGWSPLPGGPYADIDSGLQGRLPGGPTWGSPSTTYYGPGNTTGNRLPAGPQRV